MKQIDDYDKIYIQEIDMRRFWQDRGGWGVTTKLLLPTCSMLFCSRLVTSIAFKGLRMRNTTIRKLILVIPEWSLIYLPVYQI